MFLALRLTPASARALAPHATEPAARLHLTLAFLGREVNHDVLRRAASVARELARQFGPVSARVLGRGVFLGERDAHHAALRAPAVVRLRGAAVRQLGAVGLVPDATHPFVPHVTLGTTRRGGRWRKAAPPALPLHFDALVLSGGGVERVFRLRGRAAHANAGRKVRALPGQLGLFATTGAPAAPAAPLPVTPTVVSSPPPTWASVDMPDARFFAPSSATSVPFTEDLIWAFQEELDRRVEAVLLATDYSSALAARRSFEAFVEAFAAYFNRALPLAIRRVANAASVGSSLANTLAVEMNERLYGRTGVAKHTRVPILSASPGHSGLSEYRAFARDRAAWSRNARKAFREAFDMLRRLLRLETSGGAPVFNSGKHNHLVLHLPRFVPLEVAGVKVRTHGLEDLDDEVRQRAMTKLEAALQLLRARTQYAAPWLFKALPQLAVVADCWGSTRGYAGLYTDDERLIRLCATVMAGYTVRATAHTIGHEAGHHLWHTVLSDDAKAEWTALRKADRVDLPLQTLLDRWPQGMGVMEFLRRLEDEDPRLYLQVEEALTEGSLTRVTVRKDLADEAAVRPKLRVPASPITAYAEKNDEEAFCEALGIGAAYGARALLPNVAQWLRTVVPTVRTFANGARGRPRARTRM